MGHHGAPLFLHVTNLFVKIPIEKRVAAFLVGEIQHRNLA